VADREIEAMRKRLDGLTVGRQFADEVSPEALAKEFGSTPADLGAAIARADALRQARMVREIMPEEIGPNFKPADTLAPPKPSEEITPEATKALETQAAAVLETPGRMGELREAAIRDLDAADLQMKDAQAALGCAMGSI